MKRNIWVKNSSLVLSSFTLRHIHWSVINFIKLNKCVDGFIHRSNTLMHYLNLTITNLDDLWSDSTYGWISRWTQLVALIDRSYRSKRIFHFPENSRFNLIFTQILWSKLAWLKASCLNEMKSHFLFHAFRSFFSVILFSLFILFWFSHFDIFILT